MRKIKILPQSLLSAIEHLKDFTGKTIDAYNSGSLTNELVRSHIWYEIHRTLHGLASSNDVKHTLELRISCKDSDYLESCLVDAYALAKKFGAEQWIVRWIGARSPGDDNVCYVTVYPVYTQSQVQELIDEIVMDDKKDGIMVSIRDWTYGAKVV
jgi:hypothetical protein